jgi:ParB family transcriptional regulator, chromosome partitioning protein
MDALELARRFDRSASWVSRRLALVAALPPEVQEHVRRGDVVAHAAMKFLVPLARANRRACIRLSTQLATRRTSTREVATLYAGWLAGDDDEREALLADPWLYLRLRAEMDAAPESEERVADVLVRELSAIAAIARRVHRTLREGAAQQHLSSTEREDARRALALAHSSFEQLHGRATRDLADVGPNDALSDPATA